ncbi:recombinase family protein [Promicromonospora soli]
MTKAAIYARISADPEGRALGISRQVEDCRALAERLGLDVVQVFEENDISASTNSTKPRPLYNEMLARARAGDFGAIIGYSNSRITRRPRELEDLIDLHNRYGTRLRTVVSGEDDLATADGRMTARIKASVDAAEAERTSERARRAKRQAAADGRHRGGPRPFGWEKDGMTVRPDEAAALLNAARGVLAGRTLAALAREMNQAGITTTTGRAWTYSALRTALCRPRNAALVSHGRADRPGMELVGRAAWPAIIPEDVWRATRDALMDPARRIQRGNERKWLGSGLYRCGLCNDASSTLRVAPYGANTGTRRWLYRCTTAAHLTVSQDLADAVVSGAARARLAQLDLSDVLMVDVDDRAEPLRAEREALQARLAVFEADYAQSLITGKQLADATARVEAEVRQIDAKLSRLVGGGPLASLAASADPEAAFDAAPLDVQRALIDVLMVVTIAPSGRGQKLGPERVRVEWKG